jgi:aspartyl-tRNA(Asn)/glutamyl-tRNA(Gln) amidotransferase subunit B
MRLIPIIGLEIHVRLKTKSKMFSDCPNVDDAAPANTAIDMVSTGQPGALPAVNAEAVRLGVRAGLALGCHVPDVAHFDRKNYFYPDLPKGYQISQYDHPICENGSVTVEVPGQLAPRDIVRIGVTRAHLEEDAAKNIHDASTNSTLVDFNRAGVPLLEIVSEPDLRSPAEAKAYLQEVQSILRAVGASDADMEKGYMRCDANISMLEVDEENHSLSSSFNPKIEVKNLNSFRAVERALTYEIERQTKMHAAGEMPVGATRGWDENKGLTFEQRLKESSADYRYFPEPDLPPLDLRSVREEEKAKLPSLPAELRARLIEDYKFTADDARFFVANGWTDYVENVMGELPGWQETSPEIAKLAGSWLKNKLAGLLAAHEKTIEGVNITPEDFAEFLHLVDDGIINSANAQKLLTLMHETGIDPSHLMEEHNLGQMDDPAALTKLVSELIEQNPEQVEQIKAGKVALVKWFVGVIMKSTEGRANPTAAEDEVKKQLGL